MFSKRRASPLGRIEASILEHVPAKYQNSVIGVYRMGMSMWRTGIIGMVLWLFAAVSFFLSKNQYPIEQLITYISLLMVSFGLAFLGARYSRMKMTPPNALGWALLVGIICLIFTGFFGFAFIALLLTDMAAIFGEATIVVAEAIYFVLTILPLVILVNIIYYLFFARRGYEKWYKDYARRHHLGEEARTVKKSAPKQTDGEYVDDDL